MKNEKGITLASLVITIIVLMILASIVTYSGVGTIRYTNYNKAKAEIEMMQANVNTWYDEYKKIEVTEEEIPEGETAEDVLESKQQLFITQYGVPTSDPSCDNNIFNSTMQGVHENGYTVILNNTIEGSAQNGYTINADNLMFLSAQALKNIFGIDFTYDYLVNIPERQVILFNGVVYNGKTYYTAEDFGIMNVSNYELDTVNFNVIQGDYDEIFIYNLRFVDTQSKELNISKFRVLISEHGANSWKDVTNNITETTYNDGKAYYLKDLEYKYYDIKVATLDDKTNQIDIELIEPRAIFKTGVEINAKMKQLAGIEGATYETEDTNIKEIKRATKEQFEENADNAEIVSTSEQDGSNTPIYMWFDNDNNNGIIYYYSKALKPELNGDSSYLFYFCTKATNIDISSVDTSNTTNMRGMFGNCYNLTSLNVSNFNTSKVTNMKEMFNGCLVLTSLNTSSFDTSNVTDMERMFCDCREITSLDVSSFNTSKVTKMYRMFSNCYKLITIYASNNFVTTNFQNYIAQEEGEVVLDPTDMFYSSYRLVGGAGTSYNLNKINKAYARIDGGTSDSGYFTTKPSL